jgi:small subunit ribosomal protein S4
LGDPKKARKQFSRPRSPWRADQLAQELYLLGTFGLRNKRELWKAQTQLSSIRKQARTLLAATQVVREREEKKLLDSLKKRGLIREEATLDDILSLTVEDMLARRLQSMVFKKGMALSPLHGRQLIVHGHIAVGDRIITVPGYEVGGAEEANVRLIAREPAKETPPVPEPAQAAEAPAEPLAEAAPAEQPAEAK